MGKDLFLYNVTFNADIPIKQLGSGAFSVKVLAASQDTAEIAALDSVYVAKVEFLDKIISASDE